MTGIILKALWDMRGAILIALMGASLLFMEHEIKAKDAALALAKSQTTKQAQEIIALQSIAKQRESAINAALEKERKLNDGKTQLENEINTAPVIEDNVVAPVGIRAIDGLRKLEGIPATGPQRVRHTG